MLQHAPVVLGFLHAACWGFAIVDFGCRAAGAGAKLLVLDACGFWSRGLGAGFRAWGPKHDFICSWVLAQDTTQVPRVQS